MYDLYGPDDEEEKQRAIEALSAGEVGPDVPPAVAANAAPLPADEQGPIQALAREADAGAPAAGQYNDPAPPKDENAPGLSGWAIAADMLFNKGRGLGGIISQSEKQKSDYLKAKGSGKDHAEELALHRRALDLQEHGQQLSEQQQAARAKALEGKGEQADKDREGMLSRIREINPDAADALTDASPTAIRAFMTQLNVDYRHKMAPELNQDAADRAGGVKQSVLDTEHGNIDRTTGDKAQTAGAEAGARLPAQQAMKATPSPSEARAAANEDLLHGDMPGVNIRDRTAWSASTMTPTERSKIGSDTASFRGAVSALDDAAKIRRENGTELWGPQKAAYEAAMSRAVSGFAELGKTGVLNQKEYERYRDMLPSITPGGADVADWVSGLVNHGGDTHLKQIEAVRDELKSLAQSKFGSRGAELSFDPIAPAAAPQAAPAVEPPAVGGMPKLTTPTSTNTPLVTPLDEDEELRKLGMRRIGQ